MLEKTLFTLDVPYRDPYQLKAFCFGVDTDGRALGEGADADGLAADASADCEGRALGEGVDPEAFEPALCLVGGLRGNEVQQMLICARLVAKLTDLEAEGALAPGKLIVVVPCANPVSMGIGRRFWIGDKTDINRMFPGYDQGETTQRIAAALFSAVQGFQYGIHFSSFYLEGDFLPHVRVMHGPGEQGNHGTDFGLPFVLHHVPGSFDTTTLHYNWRLWDTEAYTLYTKETALADLGSADDIARAVLRFADARGILTWPNHGGWRATELEEQFLAPVQTPVGGVFCPHVSLGDNVERGQLLASIVDPMRGTECAQLSAPCDGMILYASRTPLVNEQTLAFQIVPPDAGASDAPARGNFLDPEA